MDPLRTKRQSMRTRSEGPSGKSEKSFQNTRQHAKRLHGDYNSISSHVAGSASPKTTNLTNTDNTDHSHANDGANGSTTSNNGKSRNNTYIPPVKSREHNTRSRNGIRKDFKPPCIPSENEVKEENALDEMIEDVVDQLSRLDDEAYRQEQAKDTDTILSQLVMPMSLPWTHRLDAFRVISHDIDDLEGIIETEESFPGQDRLGDVGETRSASMPEYLVEAARRSSLDPGIIEYTRFRVPLSFNIASEPAQSHQVQPESVLAHSPLGFVEEVNRRKRRRLEIIGKNTEKFGISICFGGASSRSSLKPTRSSLIETACLFAKLPNEIHGGRRVDALRAAEEASHLGSYDHRHGLPRLSETAKRVRTGRTRIVWSSKQSQSQRSLHKSILTGTIIETGQQRRPSDVKVYIRHNGRILTLGEGHSRKPSDSEEDDEWAGAGYSYTAIETALTIAEQHEPANSAKESLQCSLNTATYLEHISRRTSTANGFVKRNLEQYSIRVFEKDQLWLNIHPPQIWSHPCEDGVFQVVCTKPGELKGIQYTQTASAGSNAVGVIRKAYPWATAVLLDAMAKQHQACCICWSESDDENGKDLNVCIHCHVQVHPKCYDGKKVFNPNWCCDSCLDFMDRSGVLPASLTPRDVRWARVCRLCPHYGSAIGLHQCEDERSWVHLSCRAWQQANAFDEGCCVICSRTSKYLVRCAATGCSLLFHPMCAKIVSHAAAVNRANNRTCFSGSIERDNDRDIFLSTQYSHEVITVTFGKKKSAKRNLPIAYCGFHNPRRARDRYGLQAGALNIKEAVRLPMLREAQS